MWLEEFEHILMESKNRENRQKMSSAFEVKLLNENVLC